MAHATRQAAIKTLKMPSSSGSRQTAVESRNRAGGWWWHDAPIAFVQKGDLVIIEAENSRCAVTDADLKFWQRAICWFLAGTSKPKCPCTPPCWLAAFQQI